MKLCGNYSFRIRETLHFLLELVTIVMKGNLSPLCPFEFGCFEYLFELEPKKISCPRLSQNNFSAILMFFNNCRKGGERNLADYCHSNHSLNSSHILRLLNMLDVGASLGVFCQASCNRRKELDGSQFIMSTESTTDRFPLSPPLQHR